MPPNNQSAPQQPNQAQPGAIGGGEQTQQQQTQASNPNSAQNSLQFAEIRDGMVVMNDGTFRAIIACQSINFDLMSSREREGVEYSYQNFLNSLHHPVQILVRSQRVDIAPYIDKLANLRRDEDNMLLSVLMDDYISFIDILAQEANIMDKSFYIVVPFFPEGDLSNLKNQAKGFFGKLFAKPASVTTIDSPSYEKAKTEINNRTESVISGLFAIGINSVRLSTTEISELYYNFYNPDTAIREPLRNYEKVTSIYTRKGEGEPVPLQAPPQQQQGGSRG